ncbi:hypothetical protein AX16_007277 [Volvariella volvacea WC 439]|nr:hypothetical protein AX16_007277 [Volvariella volvacea WC 439]
MKPLTLLQFLLLSPLAVLAQQTGYGQCGGQGWTGPTTCVAGFTCVYQNDWYSQCVPSSSSSTVTQQPPSSTTTTTSSPNPTGTFNNPPLWVDNPDVDIIQVNGTFYYSSSTFHYSPGAPILRSYDLINWEFIGHSVPVLDWGSQYDLTNGNRAYIKGIWASFFNYRKSNNLWYWGGCVEFGRTYIYTAPTVTGPWSRRATLSNTCWYDSGLLIDDNDTMYVAYGNTNISVVQLAPDGFSAVRTQLVYPAPFYLEGSRMYKRDGWYYIFLSRPNNGEFVLKSRSPWGPYEQRAVVDSVPPPSNMGGSPPHQGGIVQTQNGQWYYMAFVDAYPTGRTPVLAPITWDSNGWPIVTLVSGRWGVTYPRPNLPAPPVQVKSPVGTDTFTSIGHEWEWNHNPDNSKWSLSGGLRLSTATVTYDLYQARNTLTRRTLGPQSTATIILNYSSMANGDRAGLALLRDQSAWVGVVKDNGGCRVAVSTGINLVDRTWTTASTGTIAASTNIPASGRIWLRITADLRSTTSDRRGRFSYSLDGTTWTSIGPAFVYNTNWTFFPGYRYAIFNYATLALGGSVTVSSFTLTAP